MRQERGAAHAAKLDVAQASDASGIESADTFVRPIYAGNAFAAVRSKHPVKILTVVRTAFDSAGERRQRSDRERDGGAGHWAVEGHGPGAHALVGDLFQLVPKRTQ